jgi:hypothetical protein
MQPRIIVMSITALALALGLMRFVSLFQPADAPSVRAGLAEPSSATAETGPAGVAGGAGGRHDTSGEPRRAIAPSRSSEWLEPPVSLELETTAAGPPISLGRPLDADPAGASEPIGPDDGPIDIGPRMDADDPLDDPVKTSSGSPINIGEPLDADQGAPPLSDEDPVSIGLELDADDPRGWDLDAPAPPGVEIGERVEAGAPRNR